MEKESDSVETPQEPAEENIEDLKVSSGEEMPSPDVSTEPVKPQEVSEPSETPAQVAQVQEEPKPAKPSFFKRAMHFLFSKETRVGRVMQPVLRTTGLIVGMLAIGVLVAYFTMYLPVRQQRDQALSEIVRLNGEIESVQTDLDETQSELDALSASSEAEIADLQAENELSSFRVYFLIAKNDVLRARLALLDTESGPGGPVALAALNDLETHLQDLLPYVEKNDSVLAGLLQNRIKVVKGELVRDSQQAKTELESFYANLLELENTLFK